MTSCPDCIWTTAAGLRDTATAFLQELVHEIAAAKYDLVGLSLTFQLAPAISLANLIKQSTDSAAIVMGGSACDGEPGLAIHKGFPWVDFLVRGEGERVIVDLVTHLSGFHDAPALDSIPGLIWRDGEHSAANGERTPIIEDLNRIARPDFRGWVTQLELSGLGLQPEDSVITVETSRGCWFGQKSHCIFCGLNGENLAFRRKSSSTILRDLSAIADLGTVNVEAVDLIMDMSFFKRLLPALAARGPQLSLFYETKANLNHEQVSLLRKAGITSIQAGIESLSGPILKIMKKGVRPHQNIWLLKWCLQYDLRVIWNVLYGFPGENPEEYTRMAELIPYLVHLPPPSEGCTPVLLNRFSPLFERYPTWGIQSVTAVAGYQAVFWSLHREA